MKKLLFFALLTSLVLVGCAKADETAPATGTPPAAGTEGSPDAKPATTTEAK
jgi:nitrous oxide reductase accessory protein NosL